MNLRQKKIALFMLAGILASGFPIAAACSSHCVSGGADLSIPQGFFCLFIGHGYAPSGVFIPVLYFIATGFYLVAKTLFLPPGFAAILLRPPRTCFN